MTRPTLLFISQFAQPGTYNKALWRRVQGEDDETVPILALMDALAVTPAVNVRTIRAHEGERLPDDLGGIDAVILGGSFASVADDYPWQRAIARFLAAWRATGKPLLGICGGHQIMTTVLGGRVERSPHGPEFGSLPVTPTTAGAAHPLFEGFEDGALFHFGNFDRVVEPSAGSVVLATRPNLPAAALDHGGAWVSVQFHPEITCDRMATCWAELDPSKAAAYRFIPGCERMILNFIRSAGLLDDAVRPRLTDERLDQVP
ncbi:type 1 glutamine amidotransferase [Xanthobacter autotrophicus DSM 431]|uniref:type 1 glutamine amidotransferase n=1 Tax=Xanthobacter nonsaccharivorans TaxID=3119912 RepID=UPI003729C53C